MPAKKAKKIQSEKEPEVNEVEELKEVKPQMVLKTEVVGEEKLPEVNQVSQLAQVVEPVTVDPPAVSESSDATESPVMPVDTPVVPEKKKVGMLWPVWIVLAFLLGAGAGFLLSKVNFDKKSVVVPTMVETPKVTPTIEPTKEPEMKFDRAEIKVKVLNGSGVRGAAGIKGDALESLGYKEVVVGNVDGENYETSEVSIKESLKIYEKEILQDLGMTAAKPLILAADDAFDVLLIIGEK